MLGDVGIKKSVLVWFSDSSLVNKRNFCYLFQNNITKKHLKVRKEQSTLSRHEGGYLFNRNENTSRIISSSNTRKRGKF